MELIRGFRPDTEVECAFMREKLRLMRNPREEYFREKRLGTDWTKKGKVYSKHAALVEAVKRLRLEMVREVEEYNKMPIERVVKMVRAWRDPKQLAGVHKR